MLYDVIKANYLEGYKLKIEFENGFSGIVDLSQYPQKGGVFSKFSDLSFFRNFKVSKSLGTIVWNKEVDIAPETLYAKCEQITSENG
jgi:hypothetical protein